VSVSYGYYVSVAFVEAVHFVRLVSAKEGKFDLSPESTAAAHTFSNDLLIEIQSTLDAVCVSPIH
jgi:hypothetical protein